MTITIRQAADADLDAIARIGAQCFPGADAGARADRIRRSQIAGIEHLLVAEEAGRIIGSATLAPRRMWWGGAEWDMGGLASVAVAPEARRRGAAKRLCEEAVERLRDQGVGLCLLYPFDSLFYSRLGWSLVGFSRRLTIRAAHLPEGDCDQVEFLQPLIDGEAIRACQQRWLAHRGVGLVRHASVWESLFHRPDWQWFGLRGEDGLDGYLACRTARDPNLLETTVEVGDMFAVSPRARRQLLSFLRHQDMQATWVTLEQPSDAPLEILLERPQAQGATDLDNGHFLSSQVCTGAMVKVLNWGQLLGGMRPQGTWLRRTVSVGLQSGPRWRLNIDGHWVEVDNDNSDIAITSNEQTLTQLAWGAMTLEQAHDWGLVAIRGSEQDLRAVSSALVSPSLFIPRWDGF